MDQQERDSNPGGWRKGGFIYTSRPVPGSLQNGTGPLAQSCWFLCLRMQKQASGKDKSRCGSLSFAGRLQHITVAHHITLAHLWQKDIHCFLHNGLKQGPGWGREFLLAFRSFPGFLYHSLLLLFIIPYDHFWDVI
jgi:hypothetical protein